MIHLTPLSFSSELGPANLDPTGITRPFVSAVLPGPTLTDRNRAQVATLINTWLLASKLLFCATGSARRRVALSPRAQTPETKCRRPLNIPLPLWLAGNNKPIPSPPNLPLDESFPATWPCEGFWKSVAVKFTPARAQKRVTPTFWLAQLFLISWRTPRSCSTLNGVEDLSSQLPLTVTAALVLQLTPLCGFWLCTFVFLKTHDTPLCLDAIS